jgi:hypothetical protein
MTHSSLPLNGLSQLAPDYQVLLCDIWGVIHNGVAAWPSAVDALFEARQAGLTVILFPTRRVPTRQCAPNWNAWACAPMPMTTLSPPVM